MLFERIESEGLAHYSYLIGAGDEALVIDPRRDCDVYLEKTAKAGLRIVNILETHRNEDYVIGSLELAARTGAQIWHADSWLDYVYGQPVEDGETWRIGPYTLKAISTPGHTPGSMSYLLHDSSGAPWILFSGDTLMAGDVGRVDLLGPDRLDQMAGMLYDSLTERILPLGDGVILCAAHGAGSVCGGAIADRAWTTIGLERRLNPKLQFSDKESFVRNTAEQLEIPPYFKQMEKLNLQGPPLLRYSPIPRPLSADEFPGLEVNVQILDGRMETSFGAAHVPQALSIWPGGVAAFAGWFLSYEKPILLVGESDDPTPIMKDLLRLGFDDVSGYLAGGMLAWHTSGKPSASIETITVHDFCRKLDENEDAWILDVRSESELEQQGRIKGAHNIHITQLPNSLDRVPGDKPVYIFCGSGLRSMTGASLLQKHGWSEPRVVLGGLSGWNSGVCPVDR